MIDIDKHAANMGGPCRVTTRVGWLKHLSLPIKCTHR